MPRFLDSVAVATISPSPQPSQFILELFPSRHDKKNFQKHPVKFQQSVAFSYLRPINSQVPSEYQVRVRLLTTEECNGRKRYNQKKNINREICSQHVAYMNCRESVWNKALYMLPPGSATHH